MVTELSGQPPAKYPAVSTAVDQFDPLFTEYWNCFNVQAAAPSGSRSLKVTVTSPVPSVDWTQLAAGIASSAVKPTKGRLLVKPFTSVAQAVSFPASSTAQILK